MDKINEIINIILSEAEAKAEQIMARADQEIAADTSKNDAEILQEREQAENSRKSEIEAINLRNRSLVESRLRQQKLAQKQALIQSVIDQAVEQIVEYPDQKKIEFYTNVIKQRGINKGSIRVNHEDQKILDALLNNLGDGFTKGEPALIKGGLIVSHDLIEENFSLDLVLRDRRSELSSLVANILFE